MCRPLVPIPVLVVLAAAAPAVQAQLGSVVRDEQYGFTFQPPVGWLDLRPSVAMGELKHLKHPHDLGRVIISAYPAPSLDFGRHAALALAKKKMRREGLTFTTLAAHRRITVNGLAGKRDQLSLQLKQPPIPIEGEAIFLPAPPYVFVLLGAWAKGLGPQRTVQASLRSFRLVRKPGPPTESAAYETTRFRFSFPKTWQATPKPGEPNTVEIKPPGKQGEYLDCTLAAAKWPEVSAAFGVTRAQYQADPTGALDRLCTAVNAKFEKALRADLEQQRRKSATEPFILELGAFRDIKREDLKAGPFVGRQLTLEIPVKYSELDAEVVFVARCAALCHGEDLVAFVSHSPREWESTHGAALQQILESVRPLATEIAAASAEPGAAPEPTKAPTEPKAAEQPAAPDEAAQAKARQHYAAGLTHKQAKQWPAAIAELTKALEIWPDYADAHWVLAWSYIGAGSKPQAVPHLEKLIQLEPNTERARQARDALERIQQ